MSGSGFSAADPYERKRVAVLDSEIAYVETGTGDPVVFLHGNPTSSYLWRNVIPHVEPLGRCLAPDLIGMGRSGRSPAGAYRFVDHIRYMDAWFEALGIAENVTLVGHDWGGAIAFHWARRHPERVRALVYMETILRPRRWTDFPAGRDKMFRAFRSAEGEAMILDDNFFVEQVIPRSIQRTLSTAEMDVYRALYPDRESRRPVLEWPRELPIEGEPADVVAIVEDYGAWLCETGTPKLFINAEPGAVVVGATRDFCRGFANQTEVTVEGIHFVQEDAPHQIGAAIADFLHGLDGA